MMRTRSAKIVAALVLALGLVLSGVALQLQRPPGPLQPGPVLPPTVGVPAVLAGEFDLQPTAADSRGVAPHSRFLLETPRTLSAGEVERALQVEPAVALQVVALGAEGRRFELIPTEPLAADRVYRLGLDLSHAAEGRLYQWAFQTQGRFRVLGSLPRHQSSHVPLNSGIEVVLSHENFGDPQSHFQIDPPVGGRFERHKKHLVFVPTEGLLPGTVYTVTLRGDLELQGSETTLGEDFSFSFETAPLDQDSRKPYFYVENRLAEFDSATAPHFAAWHAGVERGAAGSQLSVATRVFRYPDARAFIGALKARSEVPWWASYSREQYLEDVTGLAAVASFDLPLQHSEHHHSAFVIFPEPLPPGYYITELTAADQTHQVRFQVSDIAAYVAVTATETLVWLADLQTGEPLGGAQVRPDGGTAVTSDGDGVAVLRTPAMPDQEQGPLELYLTVAAYDGREMVAVAGGGMIEPLRAAGPEAYDYWKYLYLDRELYQPGDTVRFWGLLRPRDPVATPLSGLTAEVVRWDYRDLDGSYLPLVDQPVAVMDGLFLGAISLPNLQPGSYELRLQDQGRTLLSRWFRVETYAKPAYRIGVRPDRQALFAGEAVNFQLEAAFFEGTPVSNVLLEHALYPESGSVRTDQSGRATVTYRPPLPPDAGVLYSYQTFSVRAQLPEVGDIHKWEQVVVFFSDVALDVERTYTDTEAHLTMQLSEVVLDAINRGEPDFAYRGDPVAGHAVTGRVYEEIWHRHETGEYYDFIAKVVRKQYRYEYEQRPVGEFAVVSDAGGTAQHTLAIDPTKSYIVKLETRDRQGRLLQVQTHIFGRAYAGVGDEWKYYYLRRDEDKPDGYRADERVTVEFYENQRLLDDRAHGYLFFTARKGLQTHTVQDSPLYRFAFREDEIPNTYVQGVHFDGRSFHETTALLVPFDPATRRLEIRVEPDRPVYRPGDMVRLGLTVTDAAGRPVRAAVNLNLVDEALFALADQRVDLLGGLYRDYVPPLILSTRASHADMLRGGGAEKGGDGDGVRADFQDAIFFETVHTDGYGRAEAEFRVPDNLTAWRVTYQAVTQQMEAGSGTLAIPVRLPFFTHLVLSEVYRTGDEPVLTVRTYGEQLAEGAPVQVEVSQTEAQAEIWRGQFTTRAFAALQVPLPPLGRGLYAIVAAAVSGEHRDAVRLSVEVRDSLAERRAVDHHLLTVDTRLKGADNALTLLSFSDYERSRYLQLLWRLYGQAGSRVEQQLARHQAGHLLTAHFDVELPAEESNLLAYQAPDGGIAILPYADSELVLSSLAAAACAQCFDQTALALYLQRILDDPAEERWRSIVAVWGLAALDRPVLQTVRAYAGQPDLGLQEALVLALARAALGDYEPARAVYRAVLADHAEQLGPSLRLTIGRDRDEWLQATALAAALAARLGEPEAPALLQYTYENEGEDVLVLLEQLSAVQTLVPRLPAGPVRFSYELHGQMVRRELQAGEVYQLALRPDDLAGLRFTDVAGQVGVTAVYTAPVTAADIQPVAGVSLRREYRSNGRVSQRFAAGDLIEVRLDATVGAEAPVGPYEVTDFLPAGLRLVRSPQHLQRSHEPVQVAGQKVTFMVPADNRPIVYYARVVTAGTYSADGAILQHGQSGAIWFQTPVSQVVIE